MEYRKEIDGLRALAVISVIMYHAGFSFFKGGYVGVDIFFVISGFLITSNIVSELKLGSFSLINFFERRIRRILPALFVVILVCIPISWTILLPNDLNNFFKSLTFVVLSISNFFFWKDSGYFETNSELKPLLHTWSLSVEEQFYIFFPLCLVTLWKYNKRKIQYIFVAFAFLNLVVVQLSSSLMPKANFFLLQGRIWELLIGALLSHYLSESKTTLPLRFKQLLGGIGIILIVLSICSFDKNTPFPSFFTLIPVTGVALIILFACSNTLIGKFFSNKLLVGIGLISYSTYLWHQPLFAYAKYALPKPNTKIILVLILSSFFLAFLTWKFVERPFRDRSFLSRDLIFKLSFFFVLSFLIIGSASSKLLSSPLFDIESRMANALRTSDVIFSSNIDERKFIKHRIKLENSSPDVIILGSSRVMQIGKHNLSENILNLGVSGSSVEDIIAIGHLAIEKFKPSTILIGVDPWLFNANSEQIRWHSISNEYKDAIDFLTNKPSEKVKELSQKDSDLFFKTGSNFYNFVNLSKFNGIDETPCNRDKIRKDGSHIYNNISLSKSEKEKEKDFGNLLKYSMQQYVFSPELESNFELFLEKYHKHHKIILILSPYHPKLYKIMIKKQTSHPTTENEFKRLAKKYRL